MYIKIILKRDGSLLLQHFQANYARRMHFKEIIMYKEVNFGM